MSSATSIRDFKSVDDAVHAWARPGASKGAVVQFKNILQSAGVPASLFQASIKTNCRIYDSEPEKKQALKMAYWLVDEGAIEQRDQARFCLLISGPFGTGKTWLGTAVFKELVWKKQQGLWRKFHQYVREIQDSYSKGESLGKLNRFQAVPVLMIDDLGDTGIDATDDRQRLLFELVDHRNEAMLPTIITTNLNQEQLLVQFGERTFNRLLEMSAFVKMGGKNYRTSPRTPNQPG